VLSFNRLIVSGTVKEGAKATKEGRKLGVGTGYCRGLKDSGQDKSRLVEMLTTYRGIGLRGVKKPWWEFVCIVKTLGSIGLEFIIIIDDEVDQSVTYIQKRSVTDVQRRASDVLFA
jgi:hypothetical protein